MPCSCCAAADEMAGARFPASGTNGWDSRRLRARAPRSVSGLSGVQPAAIDGVAGGSSTLGERSRRPPWGERVLEGLLFSCLLRLEACCSLSGPAPGAMGLRRAREDLGTAPAGLWRGCAFGGVRWPAGRRDEGPRAATVAIRLPEVWRTGRPLVDPCAPAPPPGVRGDSGSGESQCFWVTKAAEGAPLSSEALQCGAPGEPGLPGATAPNPTPTRVQPHAARKWPTGRSTAPWPDGTRGCGVGELDPFLYWLIFCYLRWAEGWGGGRGRAGWYCWCNGAFKRSGFADSCGPCTVPCRGGPGQGRE